MSDELPLISLDAKDILLVVEAGVGPATVMTTDGSGSVETVFIQVTTMAGDAEGDEVPLQTRVLGLSPELARDLFEDLGLGLRAQGLI